MAVALVWARRGRTEEMLNSKVLWGAYSGDRRRSVEPLAKRAVHPRLVRLRNFIVITLASLALWAAIWVAVKTLASAAL